MNELLVTSLLSAALAALLPAQQQSATLSPVADTTLYASGTTLSNGAGSRCFAGTNASGSARRALVRFDVAAALPPGSTIVSAQFELTVAQSAGGPQSVAVHRITSDWGEAGSVAGSGQGGGGAAQPGDATWDSAFFPATAWQSLGGDFAATASASATVGTTGTFAWTSTQTTADVQAWLDSPASAFGWAVITDEATSRTARAYHTREAGTPTVRPSLIVRYTPPAAGVRSLGSGCNGGGAQPLTLSASGNPTVPAPAFALNMSGGPASAVQAIDFFLDVLQSPLPLGAGCSIWGNPGLFIAGVSTTGSLSLPVPNNTALIGRSLAAQGLAAAPATGSFATSNAVVLDFGI